MIVMWQMHVTNTNQAFLDCLYLGCWLFQVIGKTWLHLAWVCSVVLWALMNCMPMLYNGLQSCSNYSHMTLAIGLTKNIFLLHTKMSTHDTCQWYDL